jgi:hypothetical protein
LHFYKVGNDYLPSVTTIIHSVVPESEQIAMWRERNGSWKRDLAASQALGTVVHYRILNPLATRTIDLPVFAFEALANDALTKAEIADAMWDNLKFDIGYPRKIEDFIVCHEYRYAGTPDMVAPINGVMTLVDLKTSKNVYESHKLQLGGYYHALGRYPEQGMVVTLNTDERSNPHFKAYYGMLTKEELESYADKFLELVEKFYENGYDKTLIKDEYKNKSCPPTLRR